MNEQQILDEIAKADKEYQNARQTLSAAKKVWVEAESNLIAIKIHLERLREKLREYRNVTPDYQPDARDLEIQAFKDRINQRIKKV